LTYTDLKRRRTRVAALSATALALAALAPVGASAYRDSGGVGAGGDPGNDAGTTDTTGPADTGDGDGVFPVVGKHTYGDGLGAGRDHQGQDLLADCGKRVVAAQAGRVQQRDYHGAAGNYVVIDGQGQLQDAVYMHLMRRAEVRKGERVVAGQTIGRVGDTGNTSACHLHFELWSDPGYYEGGKPIDPEPFLRRWDRAG
jgi:murein DD-endopeptidase MepM/ murein hydrolase activator NlpD